MPDIGQRVLKDDDKLTVLIVTGHTDIHHDWRTISPMLRDLLKETEAPTAAWSTSRRSPAP